MGKYKLLIFFVILLVGFIARLYRFDGPIADWHSWRQADTSAVSRNFVNSGFDILHPRFDDLSNVPSGLNNPQGYRYVEFPIYNLFQSGLYKTLDFFTLEEWGRLVTIFSSTISIIFIFLLLVKYTDTTVGLSAAFLYALLPYNIYYGRAILPDPMMVTAILGGIFFFDLWATENKKSKHKIKQIVYFILAAIFTSSAFLLKPYALFFTLPMLAIAFNAWGFSAIRKWQLWFFLVTLIPLILWRIWMINFPEGIPSSSWLFNGDNIRFKGSFFYWIFARRIGGLILGYWATVLLVMGILLNSKSEKYFGYLKGQQLILWSFLASSLLYLFTIATGNVKHDYYQILIIPSIVIFAGLGIKFFLNPPKEYISKNLSIFILAFCIISTLAFRWYVVRDFFNVNNNSIVVAGQAIDILIPKDAKIIANYEGDTTFLYQTKRKGWASYQHELSRMRDELGASYLVIANPVSSDFNYANEYLIVEKTPQYVIFDLNKSP